MEIDQSEKENTQLESVGIPTDLAMEESDAKPSYHGSPSKNGNDIASPTNGVTTLDVNNSKLNTPNTGTNGVRLSYKIDDYIPPSSKSTHDLRNSFSWEGMLKQPEFVAAPVSAFRHAPMSDCWENIIVGMKVEVENRDSASSNSALADAYWVATVLRISGYTALLRYEGFGQDGSKDFWLNLCSERVHPVGWCATKGKPLIPPKTIQSKYNDWKDFLVKRLTGARTLPSNFYPKVQESVQSIFKQGMKLEVVDKMRICQVRVATILEITGRRLRLQYDEVDHDDREFWCHEESPLIHPVGWARRVGHQIVASQEYFDRCAMDNLRETDCKPDMFPEPQWPLPGATNNSNGMPATFQIGCKIEAVDPLNLSTICVATLMKVLRFGYIMVRIDGYENDATGSDWFCYHSSSPLIFPPGFAERNNIQLKRPTGYEDKFSWYEYLKETRSQAAPVSLFCRRDDVKHGFKVGMKVEATDLMDPRLVCVSFISRVAGRLLKVHFDGWGDEYDQWMDCDNVDIYPVGWAELVGHKLESPRPAQPLATKKEKRKGGTGGKKGAPKKRTGNTTAQSNNGTASTSPNATSQLTPSISSTSLNQQNGSRKSRRVVSPASDTSGVSTRTPTPPTVSGTATNVPASASSTSSSPSSPSILTPSADFSEQPIPAATTKISATTVTENKHTLIPEEPQGSANKPLQSNKSLTTSSTDDLSVEPMTMQDDDKEDSAEQVKIIPRLVDSAGQAAMPRGKDNNLNPTSWTVEEVAQFLQINECASLADAFQEQVNVTNKTKMRLRALYICQYTNCLESRMIIAIIFLGS